MTQRTSLGTRTAVVGRRAVTWIGLVCLVTVIGLLGTTVNRQSKEETDLARHRTLIQEIRDIIRTMPRRALATGSPVELRIDAKRGCFQLVTLVGKRKVATRIENTIWLPEGLRVLEAPAIITASASGRLSVASVVIVATASNRLFRLTTRPSALVELDEEPMS